MKTMCMRLQRAVWPCVLGGILGMGLVASAQTQSLTQPQASSPTSSPTSSSKPVASLAASAVATREAKPMANNPAIEARLVDISQELRCLVCQNESLASSHAELAEDLRREVRGLIAQGKSDADIKTFLVERYGDFVLYRPEVKPLTWVLWFGPFLLLVLAALALGMYLRQRKKQIPSIELSQAQRARAEQLLKGEQ